MPIVRAAIAFLLLLSACRLGADVITLNTPLQVSLGVRGAVELQFSSQADVYYQIEFSTDLVQWDPEGYSVKGTGGFMSVLASSRNRPSAYYRLRDDGDPANTAPVGPPGPAGPAGPTGPVGSLGPVGPQGPAGFQGVQGLQGIQGPQGIPGVGSATNAGLQGPVGPMGPQGPVGPQGPPGPTGATGTAGLNGAQGPQGPAGITPEPDGSLGIDYYDDFTGKPNGTVVGQGYQPDHGVPYELNLAAGSTPSVSSGALSSASPGVWYLGQELKNPVRSFGAQVRFDPQNAVGGYEQGVFLIMPEYVFLDKLIHIRFSRTGVSVEVSAGGGVSGFVSVLNANHANLGGGGNGLAPLGQEHTISGTIIGDTLWLSWLGRTYKVKDPRIAAVNGNWIFFEQYSTGPGASDYLKWLRVWANSPDVSTLPGVGVRPNSGSANALVESLGQGQFERKILVGSSDQNLINNNGYSMVVRGTSEVQRLRANANAGIPTFVGGTTRVVSDAAANTAGSALTSLTGSLFWGGSLTAPGDRWEGKYMGTFAANTNPKRLTFEVAGGLWFDSGNLAISNEPWELTATIYRTSTNSHNGFFKLTTPTKTLMSSATANYGFNATIGFEVRGAGVSAGDVTLKYGHESYHPAP